MTRLKNFKNDNERLRERCPNAPYVYISEHFPKEMYEQKRLSVVSLYNARRWAELCQWRKIDYSNMKRPNCLNLITREKMNRNCSKTEAT